MKLSLRQTMILLFALLFGAGLATLAPSFSKPASREPEAVAAFAQAVDATGAPTAVSTALAASPTVLPVVSPTIGENIFWAEATEGVQTSAEASALSPAPMSSPDPSAFTVEVLGTARRAPQRRVLIYHTHTYEAYRQEAGDPYEETEKWRSADEAHNVVRVGEELAALLRALGMEVEHDATAFEPPSLSGAYARSLAMLETRKSAGERYDLYIDLHRDAYSASQAGANTVNVGGTEVARLMLLVGKGEGQTEEGFDERPDWQGNLAVAQAMTDALNAQADGLCKKVMLKSGRFNQHIATGCVLVEAGNNSNTLVEALAAMPYLADAIASLPN